MDCVATAKDLCDNTSFHRTLGRRARADPERQAILRADVRQPARSRSRSRKCSTAAKRAASWRSVLEQVSAYAEQELKEQIAALTRYIEPAMIVIMGLIIGGVAMAMLLLPIFTISKVVAS